MGYDREPTLRDLIALIRRGLLPAILLAAICGAAAYFYVRNTPPTYETSASLLVSSQDPNQRDFGVTLVTAPALDVATYQAAIRSRQVLANALQLLNGYTPSRFQIDELAASLSLRAEEARNSSLLRVIVRGQNPVRISERANAVAEAAVDWDAERATRTLETIIGSLQAQIASIDAELAAASADAPVEGLTRNRAELQLQLSSARALRSAAVGRLEFLERAEPPLYPIAPRPTRDAAVAGLFAVLLVYGLLLIREMLNTRVKGPDDLAQVTGLPVLAEFPKVANGRRGLPAEVTSFLRTAVAFATAADHPKVILVTSPLANHGKSSVSIALAESFARQRFRTLLIDADLRRPVLAVEYALEPSETGSLRDALMGAGVRHWSTVSASNGVEFEIIPTFEPVADPTELLANHMRGLLSRLTPDFDVIVIDTPPVLSVADALIIAPHVTGVVLAVSVAKTDRRHAANAVGLIRRLGVRLLGVVATMVRPSQHDGGFGAYGYGYGYEVAAADERGSKAADAAAERAVPTAS